MNPLIIFGAVGAVVLFLVNKSFKKPPEVSAEEIALEKTQAGVTVPGVVGAVAKVASKIAKVLGIGGSAAAVTTTTIGLSALPAATVLPAGVVSMAPATLTSSVYAGGAGVVSPSASSALATSPVAGGSGVAAAIGGAALCVAPLVVMPVVAKLLDSIFGTGKSGLYDNPELLAKQLEITKKKKALIAAGNTPLWIPKTGFYEGEGGYESSGDPQGG